MVTFEQANVVHMGDLMFNRLHPFVDRASGARISNWIEVLEQVTAAHSADTIYIFGHGTPGAGVTGDRGEEDRQECRTTTRRRRPSRIPHSAPST